MLERAVSYIPYFSDFLDLLYVPFDFIINNIPFVEVALWILVIGVLISILFGVFRR